MNSSKYSYNLKHAPKKTPCRDGKNCKHFPHCAFFHSPENTPDWTCPHSSSLLNCLSSYMDWSSSGSYAKALYLP